MHRAACLVSHLGVQTPLARLSQGGASVRRCASTTPPPVYPNKEAAVLDGVRLAYIDHTIGEGRGPTVVALHGNPTNSFLWRKVFGVLGADTRIGRLLAPDLAGQGRSGPSQRGLSFRAHADYIDSWFDTVLPKESTPKVVLLLHDWGSALLFHWAAHNPERVEALVHMESIPGPISSWDDFPVAGRKAFKNMRTPGVGEKMVLEKDFFIQRLLLGDRVTKRADEWTAEERQAYTAAFPTPESRAQLLKWPREIPIATEPSRVVDAARHWEGVMRGSDFPKLFVNAEPGFFSPLIVRVTKEWRNHTVSRTVRGQHFIQEDSGEEIGEIILEFLHEKGVVA
eukprot:TRINITY_DN18930_c0_g1_i1.p1 TRINITY_DN18930_c0_g1~~TRINITY_DN18930_c0_g1_i1.p1  ORF type:complete len:358 (+),score=122.44 TRINITY_DN18930_c0_g1_i1:56-1075(+)